MINGLWGNEHNYCIVEIVEKLMKQGYTCYLEHKILLGTGKGLGHRLEVDIYAKKDEKEMFIEVGTLSNIHEERLALLKKLNPKAKIFHYTQWKNFLTSYDWQKENEKFQIVDIQKMGESLR